MGAPDSVLMIVEDVTERRANVCRLARLTRLYQVLSAVTEAIPEERDPERLYEKVCRVVVEQGGFSLAWVGKKRRNGLVQVLASAGVEGAAEEIAVTPGSPAGEHVRRRRRHRPRDAATRARTSLRIPKDGA